MMWIVGALCPILANLCVLSQCSIEVAVIWLELTTLDRGMYNPSPPHCPFQWPCKISDPGFTDGSLGRKSALLEFVCSILQAGHWISRWRRPDTLLSWLRGCGDWRLVPRTCGLSTVRYLTRCPVWSEITTRLPVVNTHGLLTPACVGYSLGIWMPIFTVQGLSGLFGCKNDDLQGSQNHTNSIFGWIWSQITQIFGVSSYRRF